MAIEAGPRVFGGRYVGVLKRRDLLTLDQHDIPLISADGSAAGCEGPKKAGAKTKIVKEVTGQFDREQAVGAMEDLLQTHPNRDAVFATNDQMALGLLSAFHESGIEVERVRTPWLADRQAVPFTPVPSPLHWTPPDWCIV